MKWIRFNRVVGGCKLKSKILISNEVLLKRRRGEKSIYKSLK